MAHWERYGIALLRERERRAEEASLWLAFDRLRHRPCEEHALEAKRSFLTLAKRHYPDQGGTHEGSLRLKAASMTGRGRRGVRSPRGS